MPDPKLLILKPGSLTLGNIGRQINTLGSVFLNNIFSDIIIRDKIIFDNIILDNIILDNIILYNTIFDKILIDNIIFVNIGNSVRKRRKLGFSFLDNNILDNI